MLSQSEIDALLKSSGENESSQDGERFSPVSLLDADSPDLQKKKEGKSVRPYNFWYPDRFSKEHLRAVEVLHEDLADRLGTSLPPYLRTSVRPRVVRLEQGQLHELMVDISHDSLFHIISLSPLSGQIVVTISQNVNFVILEQRLGSMGKRIHLREELTEIDQLLLRDLAEYILGDIKASWNKIITVEPRLEESTSYHWVQMTMGKERMLQVTFEMIFQDVTGYLNIFIPFTMLKPITHLLKPHLWIMSGPRERTPAEVNRREAAQRLAQMMLPLRVILGQAELTLGELANLTPGDIIPLSTPVHNELQVQVVDRPRFLALPGRIGKNLAVRITRPINPDDYDETI
jgi:flagellar motor switch protein FliM